MILALKAKINELKELASEYEENIEGWLEFKDELSIERSVRGLEICAMQVVQRINEGELNFGAEDK
jgi:hypothetical protein